MEALGIALFSGLLAFFGAIVGHLVAFDLSTLAKRRDIRRTHIERFAEYLSEDVPWMEQYFRETLFLAGGYPATEGPYEKAFALYILYFGEELAEPIKTLQIARHAYQSAMNEGLSTRCALAAQSPGGSLTNTRLPDEQLKTITEKFTPYYDASLRCLQAASKIAAATIPEKSQIRTLWESVRSWRS